MVPYAKVSSSRFQVDLQQSHFSILNSTSSRLRQVKPTPLDLRSSSRPKSTYWGRLPGLLSGCVPTFGHVPSYVLDVLHWLPIQHNLIPDNCFGPVALIGTSLRRVAHYFQCTGSSISALYWARRAQSPVSYINN